MSKCKYYKTCELYDKNSSTCNIYDGDNCGQFNNLEELEEEIKC